MPPSPIRDGGSARRQGPGGQRREPEPHLGHVLTKLGVCDRVQAVVLAYESGLVGPGEGR